MFAGCNDTTHVAVRSSGCSARTVADRLKPLLRTWKGPVDEVRVSDGKGGQAQLRLPRGFTFCTEQWIIDSLAKGVLQPAEAYRPACVAPPAPPPQAAQQPASPTRQVSPASFGAAGPAAPAQLAQLQQPEAGQGPSYSDVTAPLSEAALSAALADAQQDAQQPAAGEQQQGAAPRARPCRRVVRRGAEFVAVEGVVPQYTGGDTCLPWGAYGVWEEPFDAAAARETVHKLQRFYEKPSSFGADMPAVAAPDASEAQKPGARINTVCQHACCALRPWCIVDKLLEVKQCYISGPALQHKQTVINKSAKKLERWEQPLDTAEDVKRVELGAKTEGKVLEILQTGTCSKLGAAQEDPRVQALNLFCEVWGCGVKVAERWAAAGCRTLDDVRARVGELSLTAQQQAGLRHHSDMQVPIPRSEVGRAEQVVRQACFDLVERWGGGGDAEQTFCQGMGSYRRRAPFTHDIDIMICLPPSLDGTSCSAFMAELLRLLLSRGLLLDELSPRAYSSVHVDDEGGDGSASWSGFCRVPPAEQGAPLLPVRRIDVKVYHAAHAPYAINYFSSGTLFSKALRFWANYAPPAAKVARAANPAATGLKLSDVDLLPIQRLRPRGVASPGGTKRPYGDMNGSSDSEGSPTAAAVAAAAALSHSRRHKWGKPDGKTVELGPAVPCTDETSIFRTLSLDYVPPHMRNFGVAYNASVDR